MNLRTRFVHPWFLLSLSFFLIAFLVLPAYSGTTGKLAGNVTDSATGEPIAAANVVVQGSPRGAATDLDGVYYILNLMPDTYSIIVSSLGYATKTVTGVQISVDKTTTLNVELETSAIMGEEVTIVAERPIIEMDRTFSTSSVSAEDLEAMPVTRVQEAVNLQAGVVDGHFRGGRSGEVVYLVDGIPVQDVYDNSQATTLNQGAVQELQVISGTFNAEYGQAMSGVVNLITKEGARDYHGQLLTRGGDYLSTHDDIFYNIDDLNPGSIQDYEGSFSGPVPSTNGRLSFFSNARLDNNDGYLYGQRRWGLEHPVIISNGSVTTPELDIDPVLLDSIARESGWDVPEDYDWARALEIYDEIGVFPTFGDNEAVPMNHDRSLYLYGKLTYQLTDNLKLNYSSIWEDRNYSDYDDGWRYIPDGILNRFRRGRTNMLRGTYAISNAAFMEAGYSNTYNEYYHYLYEDPFDERYVHPFYQDISPGVTLRVGGTNTDHFRRFSDTHTGLAKINWQLNPIHYVVAGFNVNFSTVHYNQFSIIHDESIEQQDTDLFPEPLELFPLVEDFTGLNHDTYFHNPFEAAAYLQDKIELKNFIVNVGMRLDYFDPDGRVLADPLDPNIYNPLLEDRRDDRLRKRWKYWYEKVDPKWQVSPRIGIAYPISTTGVLHFAYGHFFQRPRYEYLYANPEFEIDPSQALSTVMGNADLEPEKTISYEFGLQQGITDDLALGLSVYQRDIRNLVSTDKIVTTYDAGTRYSQYTNRDFGEVRGVVLTLDKRYANGFSGQLNYTYQIAEGNASDPQDAYNAAKSNQEPVKQLLALDWDRRHTLNATINYFQPNVWGASMIAYYGSGLPYTSQNLGEEVLVLVSFENDGRKPDYLNFDLNAFYFLPFFEGTGMQASVELMVRNLFDRLNENDVFTDTGRATYTREQDLNAGQEIPVINTLEEAYTRPQYYSRPREIRFGVKFTF
jgi:Carboxypeptidase regulatory-like domain/TonB-dependent Receptor Plug Domain